MMSKDFLSKLLPKMDRVAGFLNNRNPREKMMIIVLAAVFILVLDFLFWLNPVLRVFAELSPKIAPAKQELSSLKEDLVNKDEIDKKWSKARLDLLAKDKQFVESSQTPALLENLSKLAQKSGVKITSLEPFEGGKSTSLKGNYSAIPIRVRALAGTHELGALASHLESGETFFKIKNLSISSNPLNERKHQVEIFMEAYRREK